MISFKKSATILSVSLFSAIFFFSPSHASEKLHIDPAILKVIDEIVRDMQQKTMDSVYPQMPFKNMMRGKMMTERASQNYMMQVIQPQMMQKNMQINMGSEKLRLMNLMSKF